jgi:hypothetical protein
MLEGRAAHIKLLVSPTLKAARRTTMR